MIGVRLSETGFCHTATTTIPIPIMTAMAGGNGLNAFNGRLDEQTRVVRCSGKAKQEQYAHDKGGVDVHTDQHDEQDGNGRRNEGHDGGDFSEPFMGMKKESKRAMYETIFDGGQEYPLRMFGLVRKR